MIAATTAPAGGRRLAPAKVNLFLHVGPVDAEGYHPLSSLMVFADLGDRLRLEPGTPGAGLELAVTGEFAGALAQVAAADNLVLRGVRALLARAGRPEPDARLVLDKALPVAAGLGGGSADGGAALRLVRDAFAPEVDEAGLEAVAAVLGSDGPACLRARPVLGTGRGDVLADAPGLPPLHAVLVNPRAPCPTGAVYRAYDAAGAPGSAAPPPLDAPLVDARAVADLLCASRNDLEAPAAALVPAVGEVLAELRARPETLAARLSGSGATAFALCADPAAAAALAAATVIARPLWWVRTCRLGGPWTDAPTRATSRRGRPSSLTNP